MDRQLSLPDLAATEALAQRIAPRLAAGDTLLLSGQIGAGKSSFARAVIRARMGAEVEVPSPTYTLVQTYDAGETEIWHADLYRLGDASEIEELGLIDAMETAICLIEWPEKLDTDAPANALRLGFVAAGSEHRVTLALSDHWHSRIGDCLD